MKATQASGAADEDAPTGVFVKPSASLWDAQDVARYLNHRIEALTAAVDRLTTPQVVSTAQAAQLGELTAAVRRMAAHQPLVDLRTAAEHLGVSTRTLRRMVEREEIPYRRIGRTLRFNLALLAPRT